MDALKSQFPASNFTLLALVLLLPALGAFVNGIFGKRLGKEAVRLMALAAIGGAFVASAFVRQVAGRASNAGLPRTLPRTLARAITGR